MKEFFYQKSEEAETARTVDEISLEKVEEIKKEEKTMEKKEEQKKEEKNLYFVQLNELRWAFDLGSKTDQEILSALEKTKGNADEAIILLFQ